LASPRFHGEKNPRKPSHSISSHHRISGLLRHFFLGAFGSGIAMFSVGKGVEK